MNRTVWLGKFGKTRQISEFLGIGETSWTIPAVGLPTVLLVAIWRVTEPRPRALAARAWPRSHVGEIGAEHYPMGRFAGRNDHPRGGTEFHGLSGEVQVAETRRNGETICINCTWNCNLKSWMLADEHQHLHFVRVVWNQGCRVLGTICIGLHLSPSLANFRPKNKPIETKTI